MEFYKPTVGEPEVAIILPPNLYKFGQFIGIHIVTPIQKEVPNFGKMLISISAFQLANGKRPSKTALQPHIEEALEFCDTKGVETIICVNAQYFETLTRKKLMASIGTVQPCVIEGYEHISIIPLLSPAVTQKYPSKKPIVDKGLQTVIQYLSGSYSDTKVELKSYKMLTDPIEIKEKLEELKTYPAVAWDIETTDLHHVKLEVITHAFAINEEEAWTIVEHPKYVGDNHKAIKELISDFFHSYKGKMIVHNAGFETKTYAYHYFMKSWDDYEGMYKALNEMNFEDTMLLAKAAYNSTDRVSFGLKTLAADKFGDWDADINVKNAIEEPIEKLAYYNAIDTCATWYVWNKVHKDITPEQKKFYDTIMKDTQRVFSKIMLTGLPIDYEQAKAVKKELEEDIEKVSERFYNNKYVQEAEQILRRMLSVKYNETHKVKKKTPDDFEDVRFNWNSPNQKRLLLFDVMGYEPIDYSEKTEEPKADRSAIKDYLSFETDEEKREALECLKSVSEINIILNNFLKTFLNDSIEVEKGVYRLYGNLVVAGAISFRPTANTPNLLNFPSKSLYGKKVKRVFKARNGYEIAQADYSALQNRTGAFITEAKNLIRLLHDNIDGHMFHASYFFRDELPDYEDTVEWYKMAKEKYEDIRNKAKAPAFLLQFGGGVKKLHQTIKGDFSTAERIYNIYHRELYPEIADHNEHIGQVARTQGYVPLGLGWGVRTESAASTDNKIAAKAQMSAANATTQFWDVLTLLALRDFQKLIETEGYIGRVIPHATIYDSVYIEAESTPEVIRWVNYNLVNCMKGAIKYMEQELGRESPVDLPADVEIGKTWVAEHTLSPNTTVEEIKEFLSN